MAKRAGRGNIEIKRDFVMNMDGHRQQWVEFLTSTTLGDIGMGFLKARLLSSLQGCDLLNTGGFSLASVALISKLIILFLCKGCQLPSGMGRALAIVQL